MHGLIAAQLIIAALPAVGAQKLAVLLLYRIESPGEEAYFNRLLSTPAFLRLDKGAQDRGYILYDRQQRVIYSVDHEERSILVIDPPPLTQELKAQAPAIELQVVETADVPKVKNIKPQQWRLSAAGQTCRDAFVLPGLMSGAVAAYGEYLQVLARQQALALASIPVELQDDCDNAVHIHAATALMEKGLILKSWDSGGHQQELIDFRSEFSVSIGDFELPENYRLIPMVSHR
jgi:hypothetical protein